MSKRLQPGEDCVPAGQTLDSAGGGDCGRLARELSAPRTGTGTGRRTGRRTGTGLCLLRGRLSRLGSQGSGQLCVWSPMAGGSVLWLNNVLKMGKK